MMRRRRRQTETSEIALMAVMTKAMGAFLILMVFGMKYYVPDFTAEQVARIVHASLGSVRGDLEAAGRRLKSGDYTREDLDRLRAQIDVAVAKLAQAEQDVSRLQTRLDQANSQLRRVEGERARLQAEAEAARARVQVAEAERDRLGAEVASLRAEVERLRGQDAQALQARIEALTRENRALAARRTVYAHFRYAGCGTLAIYPNLARQSARVPGRPEPVIPIDGSPGYRGFLRAGAPEETLTVNPSADGRAVVATWIGQTVQVGDALVLSTNVLNPVAPGGAASDGPSVAQAGCRVEGEIHGGGKSVGFVTTIEPAQPVVLLGLMRLTEAGLEAVRVTPEQSRWFAERLAEAPCGIPACGGSDPRARDLLAATLTAIVRGRLSLAPTGWARQGEIAGRIAEELGDRLRRGTLTEADLGRWVDLVAAVPDRPVATGNAPATDALAEIGARLAASGAPPALAAAFVERAARNWWSPEEREERLRRAGIGPAAGSFAARAAALKVPRGFAADLERGIAAGALTAEQGLDWLALVERARAAANGPPPPQPDLTRLLHLMEAKGLSELAPMRVGYGLAAGGRLPMVEAIALLSRMKGGLRP